MWRMLGSKNWQRLHPPLGSESVAGVIEIPISYVGYHAEFGHSTSNGIGLGRDLY